MRELCAAAIDAATGAGAEYADARVVLKRDQLVATKNGRVERIGDSESEGIGVRVLVGGAWGFACIRRPRSERAPSLALRQAYIRVDLLRWNRKREGIALPSSAIPSTCPSRRRSTCASVRTRHWQAVVRAQREHKLLLTSEGTEVEQELIESGGGIDCAAALDGLFQTRSYPS